MEQDKLHRQDYIAVTVIFCLGLTLRLIRLWDLDLIFDEAVLLIQARESFLGIWNLCKTDNFPPLYSWWIKIWMTFGSGADWFRISGALLGALTPSAAYLLGRESGGRKLGWALGLACAISATLLYYSQFVRMYNVQAFLACLSLYWFMKGLKTNQWRYWWFTGVANLVGFYAYVFMTFIFVAELFILIYYFRFDLQRYIRPVVSHLPFYTGALVWMIPTLHRYTQVQETFWTPELTWQIVLLNLMSLCAGGDFRSTYWLTALLLLPLVAGFMMSLILKPRNPQIIQLGFTAVFVVGVILLLSVGSRSFFHDRYLMYVLPFILAVALAGWMKLRNFRHRRWGLVLFFLAYLVFLVNYYVDFNYIHRFVGLLPEKTTATGAGHGLSLTAAEVAERLQPDEVIIHYSERYLTVCSYLPALVYHRRALPEYVYSPEDIEENNGRQYLRPGDQIRSLSDLNPLPGGVWLFTLNTPDQILGRESALWILKRNLPVELQDAGYRWMETVTNFRASAIHFRRDVGVATP